MILFRRVSPIAIVWVFTFVNMLGGTWVSRLTTIGLVLVLIPVVMTAIVGWHWFDAATYAADWNTADTTDGHAIIKSILLCLWAFVVLNPQRYVLVWLKTRNVPFRWQPLLGTGLAGIVYIAATQVLSGMYPSSVMAASGAPFAIRLQLSSVTGLRRWFLHSPPFVPDFSGLLDDVGRPGRCTCR